MKTMSPVSPPRSEIHEALEQLVSTASDLDAALDGSTSEYDSERKVLDTALKRAVAALRLAGNSPMTTPPPQACTTESAMLVNLQMLAQRLTAAACVAAEAASAMDSGKRNLAIGTVLPLENLLPEIDALYRTTILLHRSPDVVIASSVRMRTGQKSDS